MFVDTGNWTDDGRVQFVFPSKFPVSGLPELRKGRAAVRLLPNKQKLPGSSWQGEMREIEIDFASID